MTKPIDTTTNGQLWLRCPFCGDSSHSKNKAHFSIRLRDGAYFCHRCGEGGFYKAHEFLTMTGMSMTITTEGITPLSKAKGSFFKEIVRHRQPGPGSPRKSLLDRWHFNVPGKGLVDVFESRTLHGSLAGIHLRPTWEKKCRTHGKRLFGFVGKEPLFTTKPIRIVEGPYDIMTVRDICLFGLPSRKQVKALRGFRVILCPDGDVWTSSNLLSRFCNKFRISSGVMVLGVERIPDDKDPDEVPLLDRKVIGYKDMVGVLEDLKEMEKTNDW